MEQKYPINKSKEIIEYVHLLQDQEREHEHNQTPDKQEIVRTFINKLNAPIEWRSVLERFTWTKEYLDELDKLLLDLGYAARDIAISQIKHTLRERIRVFSIMDFNVFFNANIWNHIELLVQNPDKIHWAQLSSNPAASDILLKNKGKINWQYFSSNTHPLAIKVLEKNYDKINWFQLSANPAAIEILKNNRNKINWIRLSENKAAIMFLECNKHRINYSRLSKNTAALKLLQEHLLDCSNGVTTNKIDYDFISMNTNPEILELLDTDSIETEWGYLSMNPAAIPMLLERPGKINYYSLSMNTSPIAIELLKENLEDVNWEWLSANPAATDILKQNPDEIDYYGLSENPYDYYQEKIDYWNAHHILQCSRLEL